MKRTNLGAVLFIIILLMALVVPVALAQEPEPWDRSTITLDGRCLASGEAEFTVTNGGQAMAGPSAWRMYRAGALTESGTFQLAAGAVQVWVFASNGEAVEFQADQRPGHPGSSAPKLTLTCSQPTAVTLTTFVVSAGMPLLACKKGTVVDFLDAPGGGHVVYVVWTGKTLSSSYYTTRHFKLTQRVSMCVKGVVT